MPCTLTLHHYTPPLRPGSSRDMSRMNTVNYGPFHACKSPHTLIAHQQICDLAQHTHLTGVCRLKPYGREPSLLSHAWSTRGSLGRRGTRASSCGNHTRCPASSTALAARGTHESQLVQQSTGSGLEAWRHAMGHGRVEAVAGGDRACSSVTMPVGSQARRPANGWSRGETAREEHDAPAQAAPSWQHVGGDEARTSPVRVGRVARDPRVPPRSILGLGRAASAQRSSAAACKTCSEVPEEAQAAARRAGPARVGLWVHTGLTRLLCALTSSRARCNRPLRCRGPGGKRTSCAALKHPVQRRSRGAAERVGCLACRPKRSSVPGV